MKYSLLFILFFLKLVIIQANEISHLNTHNSYELKQDSNYLSTWPFSKNIFGSSTERISAPA